MTDLTLRSQEGTRDAEALRVALEAARPTIGDETRHDVSPNNSASYWGALNKVTLAACTTLMSAAWAVGDDKKNSTLRATGFGLNSLYKAEKSLKDLVDGKHESSGVHFLNSVGTLLWSVGTGVSDRGLKTAGPALNAVVNAVSAVKSYHQGEEWLGKALEANEMAWFAAASFTGSPWAGALGFVGMGVGFANDAREDKSLLGHVLGAGVWALGEGRGSDLLRSIGPGGMAVAEGVRLLWPICEDFARKRSLAPQQPGSGPILPECGSVHTMNSPEAGGSVEHRNSSERSYHAHAPASPAPSEVALYSLPAGSASLEALSVRAPSSPAPSEAFVSAPSSPAPSEAFVSAPSSPAPPAASLYGPPTLASGPPDVKGGPSRPSTGGAWTPGPAQAARGHKV